ncbi:RHS repeat domain-containing protein [Pirellulaceae bacterium SH501]
MLIAFCVEHLPRRSECDAFDQRTAKRVDTDGNGTWDRYEVYAWADGQEVQRWVDTDGAGTGQKLRLANRYLWAESVDQLLSDEQYASGTGMEIDATTASGTAGTTLWALTDHLGSVRDLLDNNGVVREHNVFDSFGRLIREVDYNSSGTAISSTDAAAVDSIFGYTGRDWDADIGMQYNRARWYDPQTGRWLSQDPIGFAAGDANLYRYVGNHPTMSRDPSGLQEPGKSPNLIPLVEDGSSPSSSPRTIEILWPNPKGFGIRDGHTFPAFDRYFFEQDPYGFFFKYGYIPEPYRVSGPYVSDSEKLERRQRERLVNIRSLIQEMIRVGDCLAEREGKYSGYDLSGLDMSKFRKDEWSVLRDHMQYALDNHRGIGWFDVRIVNGSSYNIPIIPGINLDKESFFGEDGMAVHVFVHEPMHNLSREGLYHDFNYLNGHSISEIVGPYSSSNYMDRFIFMLQRARMASGESVWQGMRRHSKWESKCK